MSETELMLRRENAELRRLLKKSKQPKSWYKSGRPREWNDTWMPLFLRLLKSGSSVRAACREVRKAGGPSRATIYTHAALCPEFGDQWKAIVAEAQKEAA